MQLHVWTDFSKLYETSNIGENKMHIRIIHVTGCPTGLDEIEPNDILTTLILDTFTQFLSRPTFNFQHCHTFNNSYTVMCPNVICKCNLEFFFPIGFYWVFQF